MELWIRSQKGLILKKVDQVYTEFKGTEGICFVRDNSDILGEYETNKRALEVLDEIQRILKPVVFMNREINIDDNSWVENGIIFQKLKDTTPDIKTLDTYVYEMPEE